MFYCRFTFQLWTRLLSLFHKGGETKDGTPTCILPGPTTRDGVS